MRKTICLAAGLTKREPMKELWRGTKEPRHRSQTSWTFYNIPIYRNTGRLEDFSTTLLLMRTPVIGDNKGRGGRLRRISKGRSFLLQAGNIQKDCRGPAAERHCSQLSILSPPYSIMPIVLFSRISFMTCRRPEAR